MTGAVVDGLGKIVLPPTTTAQPRDGPMPARLTY